jgi:hypothetical protein
MKRLPTTLEKLSVLEKRMAEDAALLARQRNAIARQREKMERKVQEARWMAVGQLVEQMGLPVDDLSMLKQMLQFVQNTTIRNDQERTMSITSNVP